MKLGDFELLPGVVVVNEDPQNQGRVKACAPGLFDTNTMDEDDLMWIAPFCMSGNQSFSKQEIGSKIWIFHNVSNYFEYWYVPMFEINGNSPTVQNQDSDVLMSRSVNGDDVQVYYSREDGFNIKSGNNKISQDAEGTIVLKSGNANIEQKEDSIKLTKDDSETFSAVKAEKLISAINEFCTDLSSIAGIAAANPFTSALSTPLLQAVSKLQANMQSVKSDFVKIS